MFPFSSIFHSVGEPSSGAPESDHVGSVAVPERAKVRLQLQRLNVIMYATLIYFDDILNSRHFSLVCGRLRCFRLSLLEFGLGATGRARRARWQGPQR